MFDYTKLDTFSLIKLSQAKDGDLLVLKSDDVDENFLRYFREGLARVTKAKVAIVSIGKEDSIDLIPREDLKELLEKLSKAE